MNNIPATCLSLRISIRPDAGSYPHISPCPHPGKYVIQKSRSPIRLDVDYIFLRYQNPCSKSVMCPLLSGATCTGHRRASARFADNRCCPAVCIPESVRPMASGKVMPRESELHSRKARAIRPDSRKGGEQAAPPMIVATLVQISRHF